MKIVDRIPDAGVHGDYSMTSKRKREITTFMETGAKYAEFIRYSEKMDAETTGYRTVAKMLNAPIKIYQRGKKVYAERLDK